MKRLRLWIAVMVAIAGAPWGAMAENAALSFYDPARPGRHLVNEMVVPESLAAVVDEKPVTIYALLEYPGTAKEQKPSIAVSFNGKPVSDVKLRWRQTPGSPRWVKIKATVSPKSLDYKTTGAANKFQVTATLGNGTEFSDELVVTGTKLPDLEKERISGSFLESTGFTYNLSYKVPPQPIKIVKNIPTQGEYGFTFQLNGKLEVSPFEKTYTSQTAGGVEIILATKSYSLEIGSRDKSEWKDNKWVKTESVIFLGLSNSISLWEKSFFTLLPPEGQTVIETIPFLGLQLKKTLHEFKLSLDADPSLYGEAYLALEPKKGDDIVTGIAFGGEIDLKLSISAVIEITGLGKFGAKGMAGGKLNLDFEAPPLGFSSFSGQVYLGAEFYFLCFESQVNYTLAEFSIEKPPQGALPDGGEATPLQLVPPPEAGEQVMYPLTAQNLRAMPQASTSSLAGAKAMFNRLGTDRALTRPRLLAAAPNTKQPEIEGSAVLPVAVNTTSVAWPSIASDVKTGDFFILFGIDTREPGSTEKSAQFSKLRWLRYHNSQWTEPAPIPGGDGAAQIAPSLVKLHGERPRYLAAWQQLEDAKFNGTGFAEWLNETQVAVGLYDAKENKWATQLLGVPGRADLAPKVANNVGGLNAHLGSYGEGGAVAWISASIPKEATGEAQGMPPDAEFRLAYYIDGKWTQPDYSKPSKSPTKTFPKVPKGLLSWDFAISNTLGYIVYSEKTAEDQSRIMLQFYWGKGVPKQDDWFSPMQLSKEAGQNLNPKVLVAGKNEAIVWNQNGNLVILGGQGQLNFTNKSIAPQILRPAKEGPIPTDLKITSLHRPEGGPAHVAISWTEQTERGPSIMTTVMDADGKRWSKPMAITPGEDLESLYATTTDSLGNLVPLYVHTDISYGTVQAPDAMDKQVTVQGAPIPGREKIMIGRFRPTRDLTFAPDGLTTTSENFAAGTTVKLIARVKGEGMLGFPSVSVSFYHGNPKKGGKLIGTGKSSKPLPGGGTVDISVDWKLSEDIWDQDAATEEVYAVIQKPQGVTEWNPDNNEAILRLDEIVLDVTAQSDRAQQDGSATVEVVVQNRGFPHTGPFPVGVYDYSGNRLIKSEVIPKVTAGGVARLNIELAKDTVRGANGGDFLIKVDPDNTLKLPGHPKVETKLHISSAIH